MWNTVCEAFTVEFRFEFLLFTLGFESSSSFSIKSNDEFLYGVLFRFDFGEDFEDGVSLRERRGERLDFDLDLCSLIIKIWNSRFLLVKVDESFPKNLWLVNFVVLLLKPSFDFEKSKFYRVKFAVLTNCG